MKKSLSFVLLCSFFLYLLFPHPSPSTFNYQFFQKIPVQHQGRIKPLSSVANSSILLLHESQLVRYQGQLLSPIDCLAKIAITPEEGEKIPLIRIDNPEVLALLKKNSDDGKFYSLKEIQDFIPEIQTQASQILSVEDNQRDSYQNAIIQLWEKLLLYNGLMNSFNPFSPTGAASFQFLPPFEGLGPWQSLSDAVELFFSKNQEHPFLPPLFQTFNAYQKQDSQTFYSLSEQYFLQIEKHLPQVAFMSSFETLFNQIQPFYLSILLYTLAFVLSFLPRSFKNFSILSLLFALLLHSCGLFCRMWIEGRPPVTNLYSSAIFVGWGSVFFSLFLEKLYKNGVGTCIGAATGALSLLIAHHLMQTGDTMEMMRAVLNSNFWLSTHVVTISLGYSSSFLAGFLATAYLLKSCFEKMPSSTQASIPTMVYSIICFSTFFSFVGTILGGIWADQSWGRFWGWDPKENGALMIVLWNALILHVRWGNLANKLTLMSLAAFSNVITSFSWFGVNMLGVGLHSYGFMQSAFFWLCSFMLCQVAIIALALLKARVSKKIQG